MKKAKKNNRDWKIAAIAMAIVAWGIVVSSILDIWYPRVPMGIVNWGLCTEVIFFAWFGARQGKFSGLTIANLSMMSMWALIEVFNRLLYPVGVVSLTLVVLLDTVAAVLA